MKLERTPVRIQHLSFGIFFALTVSGPAFGCTCLKPPPDATARDMAQGHVQSSDAIFEGTVRDTELKWTLLEAPVGGLVSADLDQQEPVLQVKFDVSRSYKGADRKDLVLTTGIGGGDCGFEFRIGQQYLVYAYADKPGDLSTGICSGTGLLQQSQSNLSYLRGEPADSETTGQNTSSPPTKVCGLVASKDMNVAEGQVYLLQVGNKSPIPAEEAEVAHDGSFCFVGAEPGNYYLAFATKAEDESPSSFVFFPGTTESSEPDAIVVKSGRTKSGLVFNIPYQPKFSISGNIYISNKSPIPPDTKIYLLNANLLSFLVAYSQDVDPKGSFYFPRVLPGKYWAFVGVNSDQAPNWVTRKAEVEVNATVTGLSLELLQK